MFKCIICLAEVDDEWKSDEHIFPDALGGMLHLDDVCRPCNSHLGNAIDSPLVNNILMDMKRQVLNLPGKKGNLPNPLAKGVLADEPDVEVYFSPTGKDPTQRLRLRKTVRRTPTPDGEKLQLIVDAKDAGEIPLIMQKWIDRAKNAGKSFTVEERREVVEQRTVTYRSGMDLVAFQAGILKIAYELAYKVLGPGYLDDPVAGRFRQVLTSDKPVEAMAEAHISGTAQILGGEKKPQLRFSDNPHWLTGAILKIGRGLGCYINILNTFEGNVLVSEDAEKYSLTQGGKVFIMDVVSKQTTEEYLYELAFRLSENAPHDQA